MDPNANLSEQLDLCESIRLKGTINPLPGGMADSFWPDDQLDAECERLVELVESLHDWIQSGGVLPERWLNLSNRFQPPFS